MIERGYTARQGDATKLTANSYALRGIIDGIIDLHRRRRQGHEDDEALTQHTPIVIIIIHRHFYARSSAISAGDSLHESKVRRAMPLAARAITG